MKECKCDVNKCDIFDFMAEHVGLTVLHPGGYAATQKLANLCHLSGDTKVLDLACGKGTSAIYLSQKYKCSVVGIDISEDLITQAEILSKRNGFNDRVSFRVADALELPFSDEEFDVIVAQAMLVLVSDKQKVIQEALRVTKHDGYVGWIELSWKKQPPEEFMDTVSNVICAYCMKNVSTFEGWNELFINSGVKRLRTEKHSMEFHGMRGMISDEGLMNSFEVMFKYFTNSAVRKRMNRLNKFFKDNPEYFGYGIYVGSK